MGTEQTIGQIKADIDQLEGYNEMVEIYNKTKDKKKIQVNKPLTVLNDLSFTSPLATPSNRGGVVR